MVDLLDPRVYAIFFVDSLHCFLEVLVLPYLQREDRGLWQEEHSDKLEYSWNSCEA